jgi:dinuclear metal center YbgI/SA1388 family protein
MKRSELLSFINQYLKIDAFNDLCPNGLQVAGVDRVTKIVTAVSASVELFKKASAVNADTIIVHHGIIWNFERPLYTGGYRERLKLLICNNLNLFAYHIPLDAHPEIGNNVQLALLFGLRDVQPFGDYKGNDIGVMGEIDPVNCELFFNKIERSLSRKPVIFPYGPAEISRIGIISGGAQKEIGQAVKVGLDAFITGEVSEYIMHYAQEEKIHFISAGHYATERLGILALGDLLKNKFGLTVEFIEIENPV